MTYNAAAAPEVGVESQPDPSQQSYLAFSRHVMDQTASTESLPDTTCDELHELRVTPLFSAAVHAYASMTVPERGNARPIYPQYGVLGIKKELSIGTSVRESQTQENLILYNTEEPISTFICGSQGSGKSHTLACLLENTLVPNKNINVLSTPLTGLVFHYDKFAGYNVGQICESAYLSSANIPVKVLVAPTSLNKMRRQYSNFLGTSGSGSTLKVLPLYFSERQLSVDMMMTLMAVHETGTAAPLYISIIRQVLRDIALARQDHSTFDYTDFRYRLASLSLTGAQCTPLNLRLELLESFLLAMDQTTEAISTFDETWRFESGTLTIIDLSDQFVNEADACALFSICLKLFMDGWRSNPRVIVLDEAHKFLTHTSEASKLTDDLVSIIRQQRHLNSRVVISTQEPTLSSALLDLCNISIVHRFSSPKWYATIRAHLAGAYSELEESQHLFQKIVSLRTGEAIVFCSTAVLMDNLGSPRLLGSGFVWLKVRPRISADGGKSVCATDKCGPEIHETLSHSPVFTQLNGKSLPRPGSLAGKTNRTRAPSTNKLVEKSPQPLVPPKQEPGLSSATAADSFLPEGRRDIARRPSSASNTASKKNVVSKLRNDEISQELLDERLQLALSKAFQKNPNLPQNPEPYVKAILRNVSGQFELPPNFLKSHDVMWNGVLTKPDIILKCLIRRHCDDQCIPSNKRAGFPWLR